jgi:3-keto-disaccharide hydrolase
MIKSLFALFFLLLAFSFPKQDGWIQLFNGKDLNDWTAKFSGFEAGVNYKNTFKVEDGLLKVSYDAYEKFDGEFGHLFYKDKFSHYKIRAEYRFIGTQVPGAPKWAFRNNGLMLHCQSPQSMAIDQDFPVSVEVQLLGDDGSGNRPCGNPCTPGTNLVKDDSLITEHCPPFSNKTASADSWHTMEVVVDGGKSFTHILDGDTVAYFEKPQLDRNDPNAQQFIKDGSLIISEGYISIQAESHPAEFRNIELKIIK